MAKDSRYIVLIVRDTQVPRDLILDEVLDNIPDVVVGYTAYDDGYGKIVRDSTIKESPLKSR
jgi:hypothetical protein